jgi:hypothetical protein
MTQSKKGDLESTPQSMRLQWSTQIVERQNGVVEMHSPIRKEELDEFEEHGSINDRSEITDKPTAG